MGFCSKPAPLCCEKHQPDSNFIVSEANKANYDFDNYLDFTLEGYPFYEANGNFVRIPETMLPLFCQNMQEICHNVAGGVLRFRTNTKKMALIVSYHEKWESSTMTQMADAGFDLYRHEGEKWYFAGNFRPQIGEQFLDMEMVVSANAEVYDYMLYFPLCSWVRDLEVGVEKDAVIEQATPRKPHRKALFYGSSITHGACATRPGLTYPATLSRELDCEMLNLGFSGNCKGEPILAELFAKLDFDLFVCEYGHNAPTPEHLAATHEPFYQTIRASHPETPIIFITMPDFYHKRRLDIDAYRNVVYNTYRKAVESGDRNVFLIDGREVFPEAIRTDCTMDNCHPNDLGFRMLVNGLYPIAKPYFE